MTISIITPRSFNRDNQLYIQKHEASMKEHQPVLLQSQIQQMSTLVQPRIRRYRAYSNSSNLFSLSINLTSHIRFNNSSNDMSYPP
ncbi:hypothetical protein PROFUN_16737 [Planoprotostelium fungivorum]|uniref:Uncharacterized protein n=1 Tax=Planoprotostelium fungivorum TaxID=1890364 RepID=A0A2P6MPN9_9EUKA|nr:hypothetical protein PROFUN_16737 [Planoprotostelium fungivorum]